MAENQKPNVERIYYDGEQFIFMETPEGPVMFAEIRGEGSDLAMDANAQRICDLWNQTVDLKGGPHTDPKDCPTWYDWCHCTVDALEHNIQRAQTAEAALKDRDDLLREYIEAEISGRLPFETYSKLTTKAMKLLGLRGDQASERFARETHPYNDQTGNGYCFDCGLPYQHPEANHTAPVDVPTQIVVTNPHGRRGLRAFRGLGQG